MRYLPERPFPRYAYVPGRQPHPTTDPRGHSFGLASAEVPPLDPDDPERSAEFLHAIDLFNHGYYWEAHERWESLWHAAGRSGPLAELLKGLIKLAAAGVKAREGNAPGVRRHVLRAGELLRRAGEVPSLRALFHALNGWDLVNRCDRLAAHPGTDTTPCDDGRAVLGFEMIFETRLGL